MLPEDLTSLLDANTYAILCTLNPDGAPQSSVIWATYHGDDVLFSTILGRRKTLNMQRDPRVSLCLYDPTNPGRYVEVRGRVWLTEAGGPELIDQLSRRYDGAPFTESNPAAVRVVCRLRPDRVIVR